ncbi:MAG: prepilin-type N-terminal cleavage/methylation domain-containing protein [Candidatus Pacebacteria bacterium]|jgi:type II secretory pathway pseudopilin PulG|nr:prepilin-type N-terminal cleavage/methylation domain-containing protein [Candidatus Paceibacterota bacterium]
MSKSFTLIEIIVAIFLVTVGAGAALNVIQTTTSFTSVASDQLTASYLAQEGIEVIRNIRDGNWLEQRTNSAIFWDDGISIAEDYNLDYRSTSFPDISCSMGAEGFLKFDGNFYNCSAGQESKFKRKITIEKPQPDEMTVSVEVSWSERGRPHQVTAQTNLYNWR